MVVTIVRAFDGFNGIRWYPGYSIDIDPQIAKEWLADGRAVVDPDGVAGGPSGNLNSSDTALLASLQGSFTLGAVDSFGRITGYTKAGVSYAVTYSNAGAKVPTNLTITRVSDGALVKTVSIDGNGYPTVIA